MKIWVSKIFPRSLIATGTCVSPTSFVWIYVGLGEFDDAFAWIERAIDDRDSLIIPIKIYPFLDPLRSDPRYVALLAEGLSPEHVVAKRNLEP